MVELPQRGDSAMSQSQTSAVRKPAMEAEELVLKMAHLSRLSLDHEEIQSFSTQLEAVLGYIDQLKEVDISSVDPLLSPTSLMREHLLPPRLDSPSSPTEEGRSTLLACSPESNGTSFGVPPVL